MRNNDFDDEPDFDLFDEKMEAFRQAMLASLSKQPKPTASFVDPQIIQNATQFKEWLEMEFEVEVKCEIHELGLSNFIAISFETESWGTNSMNVLEFKQHFVKADSIGVDIHNNGKAEITFAYNNVLIHFIDKE